MTGGEGRVILDLLSAFLLTAAVVIAVLVLVTTPQSAAAFAQVVSSALGHAIGMAVGSLPDLFAAIRKGIELCRGAGGCQALMGYCLRRFWGCLRGGDSEERSAGQHR